MKKLLIPIIACWQLLNVAQPSRTQNFIEVMPPDASLLNSGANPVPQSALRAHDRTYSRSNYKFEEPYYMQMRYYYDRQQRDHEAVYQQRAREQTHRLLWAQHYEYHPHAY